MFIQFYICETYSVPAAHRQIWRIVFLLLRQPQHCFPHRLATDYNSIIYLLYLQRNYSMILNVLLSARLCCLYTVNFQVKLGEKKISCSPNSSSHFGYPVIKFTPNLFVLDCIPIVCLYQLKLKINHFYSKEIRKVVSFFIVYLLNNYCIEISTPQFICRFINKK